MRSKSQERWVERKKNRKDKKEKLDKMKPEEKC